MIVSWCLAALWVVAFLVIIKDYTDWCMEPAKAQARKNRAMLGILPLILLELFALWTVLYPNIKVPH